MNANNLLIRLQCLIVLFCIAILDIGPIPFAALGAIFIVLFRPRWLKRLIDEIYS